ncbi:PTS transporter subunit IIC, partial [Tetragenococcus koreensis]|uniref:PTS transporter subunit IIC n=1 Tax=Tetragenococcus koreensis TaxID=290335 RepID=UPI0027D998E4
SSSYGYLVFVDYYSTGELTCFLFSETKKDASDFSPTSYIIEPLLLPITIILAFVLPGSRVLPFADLASLTFLFALVAPFCNRNIFRMLISGILIVIVIFYTGTALAPEFTKAAVDSQITSVSSFEYITNLVGPVTTWVGWLFIRMSEWLAVLF